MYCTGVRSQTGPACSGSSSGPSTASEALSLLHDQNRLSASEEKDHFVLLPRSPDPGETSPAPVLTPSSALSPATASVLRALTAVPAGVSRRRVTGRKGRRFERARDGQIVARCFEPFGARPYPSIGSLTQAITVTMEYVIPFFVSSTVASVYAASNFTVGQFGGSTNFLNLFDQYRFEQLEVWIEPLTQATTSAGHSTAVDLDDSNLPTGAGNVSDKQGALVASSNVGRYHKWLPHMAVAAFSGAFTSYLNMPADWIDSASPNVQHYGIKSACGATTPSVAFNLTARAVISFRAPNIN